MSFDYNVRNKISLSLVTLGKEGAEEVRRGNEIFSFGDHQQVTCVPEHVNNNYNSCENLLKSEKNNPSIPSINNNYKSSIDDCDIDNCDTYECKDKYFSNEKFTNDFERMKVNQLLKLASETFETDFDGRSADGKSKFVRFLIEKSGEKLFNIDCLLGNGESRPFMEADEKNLKTLCSFERNCFDCDLTKDTIIEKQTKKGEETAGETLNSLRLYSVKMGALKDLIQAEKMNASALHLQLTAQTQTDVKKHRTSLEAEGRSKRARRD